MGRCLSIRKRTFPKRPRVSQFVTIDEALYQAVSVLQSNDVTPTRMLDTFVPSMPVKSIHPPLHVIPFVIDHLRSHNDRSHNPCQSPKRRTTYVFELQMSMPRISRMPRMPRISRMPRIPRMPRPPGRWTLFVLPSINRPRSSQCDL